jgi:D-psicose/D-tagatose/L-ribulose 3-epimerase
MRWRSHRYARPCDGSGFDPPRRSLPSSREITSPGSISPSLMTYPAVFVDGLSLISPERDVRRKAVQRLSDLISVTAEVGPEMIAGPPDAPRLSAWRRRTNDEWTWIIEGYQQFGDLLANHRVTLGNRTHESFRNVFFNTAADAVDLAGQVGHTNVGILYGTFHASAGKKSIAAGLLRVG